MHSEEKDPVQGQRGAAILKTLFIAAIVIGVFVAAKHLNLQQVFKDSLSWIDRAGPVGPLVFFVLYVAACVFMLPGSILSLGAGAVFGVIKGTLLVSASSIAGATAAFLVGRHLAREMVARRVEGNERFRAIDKAVAKEGWKIVGLTRLSPVFPFNLLNYAFGLTRVTLRDYFFASWIGMIPGTIMYVYIGSLAGSLAELGAKAEGQGRSPAEWVLYIIGLIATVAVTVIITNIARKALGRRIDPLGEHEEGPS